MIIEDRSISLTAMANNFAEDGVSRAMLLKTLIDQKFIIDIRTITEKGKENGIDYATNDEGDRWLVYNRSIQERLGRNIEWMKRKFPELVLSTKNKPASEIEKDIKDGKYKSLKYLDIEESNTVIIDTETTGLKDDDEVIELSVVDFNGTELYHSYFYPQKEVDPGAQKVNKMNKEKLKGNPAFSKEEWDKIVKAIDKKSIVGHNIGFDKRLIMQTLIKNDIDTAEAAELFDDDKLIDTQKIAKKWIKSNSYSLNNLTTLIGITREEQHDSTDDCRMTLEFMRRLEDIIKIKREYTFICS